MDADEEPSMKKLYCIEYPGKVCNVDRMINTLGGINSISNAFCNAQKKLELRFRPEDKFCKAVTGERSKNTSFLLKVTIKRVKSHDKDGEEKRIISAASVVGRVHKVFSFKGLMDYQYLPMERNPDGKLECIYDSIVPKCVVPLSWLGESNSSFLVPTIFSRSDSVQSYLSSNKTVDDPTTVISRTRDRRSNYVKFVSHEKKVVPNTPNPSTLRYIQSKMISNEEIMKIKELFDDRPVWTKNALACVTRYSAVQLKYLLSLRAYHFTSGPFRIAWVCFGYDPRKYPEARKYQIVDYRLRANILTVLRELNPSRYSRGRMKLNNADEDITELDENSYIFKPGFLPPQKQMFYQACDIKIPEVEEKLNQSTANLKYDPKYGWLTESMCEFIREQIDKHIIAVLQSNNSGSSNTPSTEFLLMRKTIADDGDNSSEDSCYEYSDQDDADILMDDNEDEEDDNDDL